ncbi:MULTISPECIES: IclR family transcriptional regulator [unclassified Sphingobium]|uniref:IclR family transcriptional regulator n=1 Tax=unclassified Sphingobium TaxID=2611147 RepID=UPI0015E71C8E|nr:MULTISPECIES: helix-turn-helix domain-containing protein [unclassified Sphingobium]
MKSAVRVLEILELFDRHRRALMVGEIAAALQYPQSSTSALLRSLVKIGYLTYDIHKRTFVPTQRVAFMGGWQSNPFFNEGPVLEIARQISEEAGLPVGIFRRNHTRVQWLHTIAADDAASDPSLGEQTDLLRSSTGYMLLAGLGERDIQGLVRRINSEVDSLTLVTRPSEVVARVDEARRDGYACMETGECTTVSVPLPFVQSQEQVVITLFAETREIAGQMNQIIAIVRETISRVTERCSVEMPGVERMPRPTLVPHKPAPMRMGWR